MSALPEMPGGQGVPDPRMVAVHAERTGHPRTVHWRVAGGLPSTLGDEVFRELVTRGVLESAASGPGHISTTLAAGRTWHADGAAVRSAVQRAVAAGRARHSEDTSADQDGALGRLATRILAEEIAPYAAGHGGSIVLVDVRDGTVDVELAGACHGCPAAAFTIQGRLEHRMRAEAPWLVGVRVAEHRGRS